MKRILPIFILLFLLVSVSSPLKAMLLAEIKADAYYLTYNVQAGIKGIQFLNINGDMGINENLGLRFGYFYSGAGGDYKDYLNLIIKFKAFSEATYSISGLLGLHGNSQEGMEGVSAGLAFRRYYNDRIDINGSIQTPWGSNGINLGGSLGMAFHLTERTSLQVGFRSLVLRPDSFGLLLGLVTEL